MNRYVPTKHVPTETTFASGAKRSQAKPRFDLIPVEALESLAGRLELGAATYGENNWQKGATDIVFRRDCVNHLIAHALAYVVDGNSVEDNIGAILANAAFLASFEKKLSLLELRDKARK